MIKSTSLPDNVNVAIGSENTDFAVKASRVEPFKKSLSLALYGLAITIFIGIVTFAFLGPLFKGEEVHFQANGVATVAGPDNLKPIIVPTFLITIFVLVGGGMFIRGIYMLFKKGGYFVGTPTRLVQELNGTLRSINWEQFSGDIEVKGTAQEGDISLKMRTGTVMRTRSGKETHIPDVIYLAGIPNVFEIEQICRKRIKENDPTPSTGSN